jgi:AcrR family transcriptional regulator
MFLTRVTGAPPMTSTPRARYREQVRAEVRTLALRQVAETGAGGISLNAIAKQMGLSGPALYRYFTNRDELVTELISEAYGELAETVRAAADSEDDPQRRPAVVGHAVRDWALAQPHRYFLILGTPIPGYEAPPETVEVSRSVMTVFLDIFAALPSASPRELDEHLAAHRVWTGGHEASPAAMRRALTFWTRLHGVISLELAGQFTGMGFDPDVLFEDELATILSEGH